LIPELAAAALDGAIHMACNLSTKVMKTTVGLPAMHALEGNG
jgi:hypothetical protein